MRELWQELREELDDFFDDYLVHLFHRKSHRNVTSKPVVVNGAMVFVRPAYLFAERVDNLLKLIFGVSVCISAFTASVFGFTSLSQFVSFLIGSFFGRVFMMVIGLSYLLTASWRILHLGKN